MGHADFLCPLPWGSGVPEQAHRLRGVGPSLGSGNPAGPPQGSLGSCLAAAVLSVSRSGPRLVLPSGFFSPVKEGQFLSSHKQYQAS